MTQVFAIHTTRTVKPGFVFVSQDGSAWETKSIVFVEPSKMKPGHAYIRMEAELLGDATKIQSVTLPTAFLLSDIVTNEA